MDSVYPLLRAADVLGAAEDSVSRGLSERVNFEVALFRCIEATRARLRWFQAVADALRSQVSTERGERQLYADHGGN